MQVCRAESRADHTGRLAATAGMSRLQTQHAVALQKVCGVGQLHPAANVCTSSCEALMGTLGQIGVRNGFREHFFRSGAEGVVDVVVELAQLDAVLVDELGEASLELIQGELPGEILARIEEVI